MSNWVCCGSSGNPSGLHLGNLGALRDWGHAKDYVRMQWMMLQQSEPEDFVIATGAQYSVRQFVQWSAEDPGFTLRFEGEARDERGLVEACCPAMPSPTVP